MKRALIIASAVFALASCAKEMQIVDAPEKDAVQTITVNVAPFEGQTKTAVTPSGTFSWSAGDQIGIYPVSSTLGTGQTSQQIVFKINTAAASSSATFTGTGWGLITSGSYSYFSYYPYNASAKYNEVPVSYSYNLNQTANESTAHLGANDYLYAPQITPDDAASASFSFKHLGALVEFELTVPDSVKTRNFTSMKVTASDYVFTTSGKYDPSTATSSVAPIISDNVYTDELKLSLNSGDGFAPDAYGKLHLFFLMAPAATNGKTLTIKLYDANNFVYENVSTAGCDIASNGNVRFARTMTAKDLTVATNLSATATANCYIVPEAGKYKFLANVKGNGIVPSGMTESSALDMTGCTAEVIWETVNTNAAPEVGTIVHDATIEGNYIVFEATGAQGNALIALKDDSNNIVWSWHIWSTNADLVANKQTYGGANMMDRNLGALSATPGNGLTLGFHYQWGRPCPITGGSSTSAGAFSSTRMATTNSSVWVEEETDATKGTLAYSAANPTHFIYASANNYLSGTTTVSGNWLWTANDYPTAASMPALWGTAKTMYDPCPIGWKVPAGGSTGVWSAAGFSADTFIWNATEKGRIFNSPAAYYPTAGSCGVSSTAQGGALSNFGYTCFCWSSSVNSIHGYDLCFGSSSVHPSHSSVRAFGFSVRPCQE